MHSASIVKTIARTISLADDYVLEFHYRDSKGNESIRVVSPIRLLGGNRFLGLCLSREEPRQFYIERCAKLAVRPAHEYVMPVPIRELAVAG